MFVLFGVYRITGKQTVAPSIFFQETFTIWRLQMKQACFLWRVHVTYVLVLFGVYRWKMPHGADGTCLFDLACADGRYTLVSFSVYKRNMLVLFGVYRFDICACFIWRVQIEVLVLFGVYKITGKQSPFFSKKHLPIKPCGRTVGT